MYAVAMSLYQIILTHHVYIHVRTCVGTYMYCLIILLNLSIGDRLSQLYMKWGYNVK